MSKVRSMRLGAMAMVLTWSRLAIALPTADPDPVTRKAIQAFNQQFADSSLAKTSDAAAACFAEDAVSLLPGMAPLVGRATIVKWIDDLLAKMPGYTVTKNELDIRSIQVAGDSAFEWGLTHQVIQPPAGKPVINNRGKILLVLRRDAGSWRVAREMWNAAE